MSIEKLWDYSGSSREDVAQKNIMALMRVALPRLAKFLVTQPISSAPGRNSGPPFNLYEFDSTDPFGKALGQLKEEIGKLKMVQGFPEKDLEKIQKAMDDLVDLGAIQA